MAISVMEFFQHKNVLITGASGFLGKILVEKLLRTMPGIGKIYVLLRAPDAEAARARFRNEVLRVDLFKPLRVLYGNDFDTFVWERVVPVAGDIGSNTNLGIESEAIRALLYEKLDAIVNNAATTTFDERYDVSLNVNTQGAMNVVEFAKRCSKMKVLVHVSTAYVIGEASGIISETELREGVPLVSGNGNADTGRWACCSSNGNGGPVIHDIKGELQLLDKLLGNAHANANRQSQSPWQSDIKVGNNLKELGLQRARRFGWPNTYSFTKAMGEMLVNEARDNLPVVIIRPSIIESTWSEPFPGWMEGTRTIDALLVAYGKGKLTSFLADPDLILDVIPADTVVNAMLAAAAANALKPGLSIYTVATSVANPFSYKVGTDAAYKFFLENPCKGKDDNLVLVKEPHFLQSMDSFKQFMFLRYKAPLQVLGVVNTLLCKIFAEKYTRMLRNYNYAMYLAELYEPYAFFQGRFEVNNLAKLWNNLSAEDQRMLNFDLNRIQWFRYFYNIHIPGIVKHVLK